MQMMEKVRWERCTEKGVGPEEGYDQGGISGRFI